MDEFAIIGCLVKAINPDPKNKMSTKLRAHYAQTMGVEKLAAILDCSEQQADTFVCDIKRLLAQHDVLLSQVKNQLFYNNAMNWMDLLPTQQNTDATEEVHTEETQPAITLLNVSPVTIGSDTFYLHIVMDCEGYWCKMLHQELDQAHFTTAHEEDGDYLLNSGWAHTEHKFTLS